MITQDLPDDDEVPSRTARKRSAQEITDFGRQLTQLNATQLAALDLSPELHEAITDYQRFPSHGAKRRQLLLIGKLLRAADEPAIQASLANVLREGAESIYQHHQAEIWRDRLIAGEQSLEAYVQSHPGVDAEAVNDLLRRIARATDDAQARPHRRALFRLLRQHE